MFTFVEFPCSNTDKNWNWITGAPVCLCLLWKCQQSFAKYLCGLCYLQHKVIIHLWESIWPVLCLILTVQPEFVVVFLNCPRWLLGYCIKVCNHYFPPIILPVHVSV
jgi:hypothetical protein